MSRAKNYAPDNRLQTRLSRRDLLRYGGRAGAALALMGGAVPLLAACGDDDETTPAATAATGSGGTTPAASTPASGSSGSGGQVRYAAWGGAIQDAEIEYLFKPFTEETGIEVIVTGPPDAVKTKAMVDTGNVEWDVLELGLTSVYQIGEEYFEKIDYSIFPQETIDNMPEVYRHEYGTAMYVFSTNIGWNTKMLGEGVAMETWADFWDVEKFPGKRCLQSGAGTEIPLAFALLADGVPIDELFPLDVDRAFKKLEEIKPHIVQWWETGAQPGQLLTGEQVVASSIWIGRIHSLLAEGAPIGYTFNQGSLEVSYSLIPKGARNLENAQKLIEYSTRADVQARLWGNYVEGPINDKAWDMMDPDYAKTLPTHPDNAGKQFIQDSKWWAENRAAIQERFQELILS